LPLDEYRARRRFGYTPEAPGTLPPDPDVRDAAASGRFVVQRHRARRLHYDTRLELGGVLVSWAVTRGPTLDPRQRRLAVRVEDHPIEYFDFEGRIPGGQYGAGDVIVWDWGTWTADASTPDAVDALESGELKLRLDGEKLRGGFVLLRTPIRGDLRKWLLIHRRDADAVDGWDAEEHPHSVKTGRTNDEVAAGVRARRAHRSPNRPVAMLPR